MKLFVGLFFLVLGVGWGLAPLLRKHRVQMEAVSDTWLRQQERQELIGSVQWDGVTRWPWNQSDDEQECA